jgi:tRNA(fMet)-specific endonuclease VapC
MANYLLDTNIIVIYARNSTLTSKVEQDLPLLTGEHNLVISAVSVGEVKSLAYRNKWGKEKIARLEQLLKQFLVADINAADVFEQYAIIDMFSQGILESPKLTGSARNMGKNDLWIAATASVLQLVLITTDHDFEHLDGHFLEVKKVDLDRYKG